MSYMSSGTIRELLLIWYRKCSLETIASSIPATFSSALGVRCPSVSTGLRHTVKWDMKMPICQRMFLYQMNMPRRTHLMHLRKGACINAFDAFKPYTWLIYTPFYLHVCTYNPTSRHLDAALNSSWGWRWCCAGIILLNSGIKAYVSI